MSGGEPALAGFGGIAPGARVLDAAGGRGGPAEGLARAGAKVVLLDRSAEAIAAAGVAAGLGVRRVRGDLRALPFPAGAFDAVVLRAVLHHLVDPALVLREAARVARPGAAIVVVDKTAPEDGEARAFRAVLERLRNRAHTWSFTARELASLAGTASLAVEAVEPWEDERPLEEWVSSRGSGPPWEGLLRELLASGRVRASGAVRIREGPGGVPLLGQTWASLRLRKPEGRR